MPRTPYIDKEEMYEEVVKTYEKNEVTEELHMIFWKMSKHINNMSRFKYYTIEWKEDMVMEAYVKCLKIIGKKQFKLTHENPFSYFTTCIYNCMLDQIHFENKTQKVRDRMIEVYGNDIYGIGEDAFEKPKEDKKIPNNKNFYHMAKFLRNGTNPINRRKKYKKYLARLPNGQLLGISNGWKPVEEKYNVNSGRLLKFAGQGAIPPTKMKWRKKTNLNRRNDNVAGWSIIKIVEDDDSKYIKLKLSEVEVERKPRKIKEDYIRLIDNEGNVHDFNTHAAVSKFCRDNNISWEFLKENLNKGKIKDFAKKYRGYKKVYERNKKLVGYEYKTF